MPPVPVAPPSGPGPTPRTPLGLSGLGAVGGPRGVGAGAFRVILEFLTQYDAKAAKQLEADLLRIQGQQSKLTARLQEQQRLAQTSAQLEARIRKIKQVATSAELAAITRASRERKSSNVEIRNAAKLTLSETRAELVARGLSRRDAQILFNLEKNRARAASVTALAQRRELRLRGQLTAGARTQLGVETALTQQVRLRQLLAPRLGALAVGALGGLVGGAAFGVAFAGVQTVLDAIGDSLTDLVDPANDAREALESVADAVASLAEKEDISILEAARRIVREMAPLRDDLSTAAVAQAVALQAVADAQKRANELEEISEHITALRTERIKAQVLAINDNRLINEQLYRIKYDISRIDEVGAAAENVLRTAIGQVDEVTRRETQAAEENARAKRRMAEASAFAAIQERNLASAIDHAADLAIGGIRDQIEALDEAARDRARAQEEAQLQFEQSLLLGGSVDPNAVSGQLRIMALEARINELRAAGGAVDRSALDALEERIDGLRRVGDEQERFNKLLDLQFRKSQVIRRQEGETISDFLQRRAQEQRHILEEEDELAREAVIATLEAERDKLQAQLDRFEGGNDAAIEALEKEKRLEQIRLRLAEINEEKITEARRRELQEQEDRVREFWEQVKTYGNLARVEEISAAIRFSKTMQELLSISGEIGGAKLAANQLRTWLQTGLIPPAQVGAVLEVLRALDAVIAQFNNRATALRSREFGGAGGGRQEFQHGGVFSLSNSRSPFGQNIRFGESGEEIGVVLSNKVTQALKETSRGPLVGSISFPSTGDPRRDRYELRQIIREEMARGLG